MVCQHKLVKYKGKCSSELDYKNNFKNLSIIDPWARHEIKYWLRPGEKHKVTYRPVERRAGTSAGFGYRYYNNNSVLETEAKIKDLTLT